MTNRTWNDEQLKEAVSSSKTMAEVARKLGMKAFGANNKTIKKWIVKLELSTDHFLSRGEQLKLSRGKLKKMSHKDLFSENNVDRKYIKKTIIKDKLIEYKCSICNLVEWQGQKLSLHLDHINGVNNDNRLENLRFLCPNCHSLTDTYCGKALKNAFVKEAKCLDCYKKIDKQSKRCKSCALKQRPRKIEWMELDKLISLVKEMGYSKVGRALGVSGNAVKKHIINSN
jgi:Zn finger protein HypA/HybF involved in hydrogenase expression